MSYNKSTVPNFNIKANSKGSIDIEESFEGFVLHNDGNPWMTVSKHSDGQIKELYSSYDLAYGDVLVSGLGFGILALWLCNKPEVKSVTVLEISQDVIDLFLDINDVPKNLNIINYNINEYNTDNFYDCLLLDHYEKQNLSWRLKNMSTICNKIKHDVFWGWSLEQIYLSKIYKINSLVDLKMETDLSMGWDHFVTESFPNEINLKNISSNKINEYVYTYFNKDILLASQEQF
jgi:hypothetical protein